MHYTDDNILIVENTKSTNKSQGRQWKKWTKMKYKENQTNDKSKITGNKVMEC